MATKSLEGLTDKQLMSEWDKKSKELEKLKEEVRGFSREHQRRATDASTQARLASMTDDEKSALAQAFAAEGIKSKEAVKNG